MISEIFVRSTQNSQTLPCVRLTKGLGYLWDHVCCPHTPQTPMEGVKNPTVAKIEHVLTVSVSGGYEGNIDGPGGSQNP